MAIQRDNPYAGFNFLVEIDGVASAGFSEVSGLSMEVDVIEYREGGDKLNSVRKLPGLHKVGNVTLKRGIIGQTALFDWVRGVTEGDTGTRAVVIQLLDEAHTPVLRWVLRRAWPSKWEAGPLHGKASEIAIESLTLTCEIIEID